MPWMAQYQIYRIINIGDSLNRVQTVIFLDDSFLSGEKLSLFLLLILKDLYYKSDKKIDYFCGM